MVDKTTQDRVIDVVVRTLGIQDRAASITGATALFGSLPELDSLGVLELVSNVEKEFTIRIEDADITGETFDTVDSLTEFVQLALG